MQPYANFREQFLSNERLLRKKRFIVNLCLSSSAQILVEVYNFWCMKAPRKRLISIYVKKKKWKWNIWQCLMGETLLTSSKVKIRLTRKKNSIPRSGCSALHGVNPNFKKATMKKYRSFRATTFQSGKAHLEKFDWKIAKSLSLSETKELWKLYIHFNYVLGRMSTRYAILRYAILITYCLLGASAPRVFKWQ